MEEEALNEACGVIGCVASGRWPTSVDVANIICVGLVGLQHRGQESAGIVTTDGQVGHPFYRHKGMGLVSQVFSDEAIHKLKGNLGIGHNRYSTAGSSEIGNCQPFVVETVDGLVAVAHNGELVNAKSLRRKVLQHGVGLSTMSDTELIAQLICRNHEEKEDDVDWTSRIKYLMGQTPCSYSLVLLHRDAIYACRDPLGNRPLCLGQLVSVSPDDGKTNDGWVVSSESCSFQSIGARYYREVMPGEIVRLTKDGVKSMSIVPRPSDELKGPAQAAFCIFEYVYFARADSIIEGQMVYSVRKRCGARVARESPVEADVVSTVPESATPAAFGYAEELGIPYVEVLCKNRYVGRTFIQPSNRLRRIGVAKKFGAILDNVVGKRIVLLDDSIVRGNTMGPIVRLLKNAGATEVHVRVASPPIKHPCYMGINIPTREELVANRMDNNQLAKFVGADSLEYLSIEGLVESVQQGITDRDKSDVGHCTACLSGQYPVKLDW